MELFWCLRAKCLPELCSGRTVFWGGRDQALPSQVIEPVGWDPPCATFSSVRQWRIPCSSLSVWVPASLWSPELLACCTPGFAYKILALWGSAASSWPLWDPCGHGHGWVGGSGCWAAVPRWACPHASCLRGLRDGLVLPWPSVTLTCSQLSTGKLPASTAALSEQAGYQLSCVHIKHVCHFSPNVVPRAPVF